MLTIHGKEGQHATDISRRGLFNGIPEDDHAVVVPILATRYVITSILQDGVPSGNIVNLSGVMSTSPNGMHNIHFLFGPNATGNLSVATAGNLSNPGRIVLDNAERVGIKVIETTREEHDKKMAIIQGLSHLLLVFIGEIRNPHIQTYLIDPWKTPEGTIKDMIFQNSPMEFMAKQFFDSLKMHANDPLKTFGALVEKNITQEDITKFSTPNFKRIMDALESGIRIGLNSEYIDTFRSMFEKNGFQYIGERVQSIRIKGNVS